MVEKKSQKSQEVVWVLGSNTVADQRLTPTLANNSPKLNSLSNLLITDWFTSCQLGLSMIELSRPYRWPVVACGRWPLKNQTTREPLPRRVLDTSSFWKRILQLLPDNSNPKAVIYKKLREAIYPSPKPIFCLKWKVSVNVGIGEG